MNIGDLWNAVMANQYGRAALILLITYVGVRLLIWIIAKLIPRFTSKTEAKWDDELLNKVSGPATWIAMLIGIRVALGQIALLESYKDTVAGILETLVIVVGGILIYHIVDVLITIGFVTMAKKARVRVNESLIQFFHSIIKFLMIVVVFLAILANWGVEIGPLLAGLGVAGIAIAFALQSTLANVFGGISLLLDRTVQKGDLVELESGVAGKVSRVGLRSTHIITFDNELMIVPNGKLADENVKNVALPKPQTRVVVPFGVAYGTNIERVERIVLEEIKKVSYRIKEPEPSIRFFEMGPSSLNFKAYFHVDSFDDRVIALDEANERIYKALDKAGIGIPFPQMDIHIKETPGTAKKASVKKAKKTKKAKKKRKK